MIAHHVLQQWWSLVCVPAAALVIVCVATVVDKSGALLKFGSLGVHKRKGFVDACVCLFIFDILALNGMSACACIAGCRT